MASQAPGRQESAIPPAQLGNVSSVTRDTFVAWVLLQPPRTFATAVSLLIVLVLGGKKKSPNSTPELGQVRA